MNTDSKTQDCPYCKEEIKSDAVKCKHCGSMIGETKPSHEGTCPYCKEAINPAAIKCKHCKSNLDSEEQTTGPSASPCLPSETSASVRRDFGSNAPPQPWLQDGTGGIFDGGFGAWGCWKSTCTKCLRRERVCNGTACWTICTQWTEYPCTRCIWPW